jgi:hypothetical protein
MTIGPQQEARFAKFRDRRLRIGALLRESGE